MDARVDDRLVVHGARASRVGVILELMESAGPQRYRVRWSDGHESVISPGPDATVQRDTAAEERRITRARRAVETAANLLGAGSGDELP